MDPETAEVVTDSTSSTEAAATSSPAPVDKTSEGPQTLLDAISAAVPGPQDAAESAKPAVEQEVPPVDVKDQKKPEVKAEPSEEEDLTKMPEGLTPKAQERFQKLAHMNTELTTKLEEVTGAVEPFREALQVNGIKKEQFDLAATTIGMMNKGDFEGALRVLDEQRRMISLAMGKPLPGVDALQDFPDLRDAVDQMQITEEHALELASKRNTDLRTQQATEQRNQEQQTQQKETQVIQSSLKSIDDFTKQMMVSDIDFAAVEAKLLPRISQILEGLPPERWLQAVKNAYQLVKDAGSVNRTAPEPSALRPTGTPAPGAAPKTMFDAMFGAK